MANIQRAQLPRIGWFVPRIYVVRHDPKGREYKIIITVGNNIIANWWNSLGHKRSSLFEVKSIQMTSSDVGCALLRVENNDFYKYVQPHEILSVLT